MRKKAEIDAILLQQDKARPHTSAATTDAFVCVGFTVLPHPAYSPDLAPTDFHLFPKLKEEL
jgi:histone-lysine N-methyltransferase SETMAR